MLSIVLAIGIHTANTSLLLPQEPPRAAFLDEGLLDQAWFGSGVTFQKHSDVDFFYFKPGLDLTERTLWFKPWEDPTLLKKGRDRKDGAKAAVLTDSIPATLRGGLQAALAGKAKVSRNEGDVEVVGRIVDCNAGSTAAKMLIGFGAGQENVTYDIKFVDAQTKEVLAAFHNRTISGTNLSTMETKMLKFSETFATFVLQRAFKQVN